MTDHYDVIIIGSGAGGGTLAHTLAGSGKSILLLERGDFLPREMDNWDPEPVFIDGKYISKDTWYDADGKPFQPQVHYYVGGATKLYGAALYRLRPQDFGEHPPRRRSLAGVAADLRRLRAVVHEGRVAVPGARQRRRGPHRRATARSRTRGPRSRTSRGSSSSSDDARGAAATTRSTRRAASCSTRPTGHGARASAAPGATATRAWSTPRPTPRRSRCARCSTLPNVTLLVDAEVVRLETDGTGRTVTGVVVVPRRPARGVRGRHRRRVGRGVELGQAAAALGQRPPSRTAWPTAPIRSGGTTCSTTARPSSPWPRSRTTPSSRRRSGSTTSTSAPPTTTGRPATSRWSASRTPRP